MKVLVACEESGIVTAEFRKQGHEAFSCDILPSSGGHPEWHIQGDVLPLLKERWDMIIAFPPCTHLAVSGAKHFVQKREDGRQQEGIDFFMKFTNLECPMVAIENPIGIMSTIYKKPTQIIQPWQFGHPEKKATCLWLKGLPMLESVNNVKAYMETLPESEQEKVHHMPPSTDRAKKRSKTFPGIARAMAMTWGAGYGQQMIF